MNPGKSLKPGKLYRVCQDDYDTLLFTECKTEYNGLNYGRGDQVCEVKVGSIVMVVEINSSDFEESMYSTVRLACSGGIGWTRLRLSDLKPIT